MSQAIVQQHWDWNRLIHSLQFFVLALQEGLGEPLPFLPKDRPHETFGGLRCFVASPGMNGRCVAVIRAHGSQGHRIDRTASVPCRLHEVSRWSGANQVGAHRKLLQKLSSLAQTSNFCRLRRGYIADTQLAGHWRARRDPRCT